MISRVAVFGGTSYLASLLKSQKSVNNIKYIFFSRKKKVRNYIYSLQLKKIIELLINLILLFI